jgi:hypothetical protein
MHSARRSLVLVSTLALLAGCSDGGGEGAPSASASASSAPPPVATPSAAPSAAAAAPPPSASAAPRSDCPKDSSGPGTLDQPCAGKGAARMMAAKWTGKIDDEKGPYFAVTNEGPASILYGKIAVYFYDKDKKQLEVKPAGATKPLPYLICAGSNLFSGVMKAKEKATLTFSCVKKDHVPEGTKAIEGEIITVGFADASAKKNEFYWSNKDLAPDVRPKGGVK